MNFVVLAPFRKRRPAETALRPEVWGTGRRLGVLLAPVAAGLVVGFGPGRMVWGLLGLAIVALEFGGHPRPRGDAPAMRPVGSRRRRQLRRRRIITRRRRISAQRAKARAVREARERRRSRRRMRRRRRLQARFGVSGAAVPTATTDPSAADPGAADPTATTHLGAGPEAPSLERDLADPAEDEPVIELDLTDRTVYDSEITLESGDRLESGVVGPCLELAVASDPAKPG